MKFLKIFFLFSSTVFGANAEPWFTGPLLAPSAKTVYPGHVKFQPYFENTIKLARYDSSWQLQSRKQFYTGMLRVKTKVGLLDRLDFQFTPRVILEKTQGQQSINFGDLPIGLNIQVLRPKTQEEGPFVKLLLRANIPTGDYQDLNTHKERTDMTGSGSWFPGGGFSFSNLWHFSKRHFLEFRLVSEYRFGVPVSVKGLNAYGGEKGTKGRVFPGNRFYVNGAVQYSFTQRWAFACDFIYSHSGRNRFSGKKGDLIKKASSDLFSLAPAIEYNWSQRFGAIAGVWFSLAGRNADLFINPMLSFTAYF